MLNVKKQYKSAFTLAEVLITLSIIGIVAAYTIPTIVKEYQKQIYITQLQKIYSNFQNGMRAYMAKQDCTTVSCLNVFDNISSDSAQQTRLSSTLPEIYAVAVNYGYNSSTLSSFTTRYLNSTSTVAFFNLGYTIATNDNYLISIFDDDSGNCTGYSSTTTNSKLKNYCAVILIDVNGLKSPNIAGIDFFDFMLGNDGALYPAYGKDYSLARSNNLDYYWKTETWMCGTPGVAQITGYVQGTGCGARIMESNWSVDYNY